ncbi:TspO/MBR family protein [Nocardiopsis algeriensis]|uniref:Tryptophan-rich sensory protein n=1 Tax=Nocardiopsis algeriensis TaxID=1478215 RepID=A0A841IR61_9ACTN|nr:TspO/MBR family protein [Nocardiopsis algeriensis]MBB6121153.1 tryptophan-rich sensory protein [Nocardiopsis algeriensis]
MYRTTDEHRRSGVKPWVALAVYAAAVLAAAVVGGQGAAGSGEVYQALELPSWAPPSWLFGPVWTVLYVFIALAGWLVWRASGLGGSRAFHVFYVLQLLLNALWPPLFFAGNLYGAALLELVLLVAAVAVTAVLAVRHSKVAALLLLPYLGWSVFAGCLNFAVWLAN